MDHGAEVLCPEMRVTELMQHSSGRILEPVIRIHSQTTHFRPNLGMDTSPHLGTVASVEDDKRDAVRVCEVRQQVVRVRLRQYLRTLPVIVCCSCCVECYQFFNRLLLNLRPNEALN